MTISELNAIDKAAFVGLLGGVYEHSSWVAEQVASGRPFSHPEQLMDQMRLAVETSTPQRLLNLILAHPDLAGKLALAGELTDDSRSEQTGAGLDRLTEDEFREFSDLNARYREKFGFPFIICVRKTDKAGILASFRKRIGNSPAQEKAAALSEIHEIARLRMEDLLAG